MTISSVSPTQPHEQALAMNVLKSTMQSPEQMMSLLQAAQSFTPEAQAQQQIALGNLDVRV